jgi:AraC-like DNA-binding protein
MRLVSKTPFRIADLPALIRALVPSPEERIGSRMTIAQFALGDAILAPGVTGKPRKLLGKRVVARGPRPFSNVTTSTARWPQDALMESKGIPKLVLVAHGHSDFSVGPYTIHCGEGEFIVCPSGLPHPDGSQPHLDEGHQSAGTVCCLIWFQAWESGIRCWSCYSRGTEHYYEDKRHLFILNEEVGQVFKLLFEEVENGREGYARICESLLTALVMMIHRELQASSYYLSYSTYMSEPTAASSVGRDPIVQAQEYIRSHLSQPLTIESVARKVLISRAQFTKRFRQETGKTFMEFLLECRLEHAKALLQESDWTASSISAHSGFKSYSYFGKFFRAQTGMTPGEFRLQVSSQALGSADGANISR